MLGRIALVLVVLVAVAIPATLYQREHMENANLQRQLHEAEVKHQQELESLHSHYHTQRQEWLEDYGARLYALSRDNARLEEEVRRSQWGATQALADQQAQQRADEEYRQKQLALQQQAVEAQRVAAFAQQSAADAQWHENNQAMFQQSMSDLDNFRARYRGPGNNPRMY